MALGNTEELRSFPVGAETLEVVERRDAVVDSCGDEDPRGVADGQGIDWRQEMIHRLGIAWSVAAVAKFAAHHGRAGVLPYGFLGIYDRLDEGNEAEVFFQHGKKRSDPPPVARADKPEFHCASGAQKRHELAKLDHGLSKALGVPNKIGSDGEFSVPCVGGSAGVVVGQMWEGDIPSSRIEAHGQPPVADITRAHECVKKKNGGRCRVTRRIKSHTGSVILNVTGGSRGIPFDPRAS